MTQHIDALGKACPLPVMMAKKAIDRGESSFTIAVDNKTAVDNLTSLAKRTSFSVQKSEQGGTFLLSFMASGDAGMQPRTAEMSESAEKTGAQPNPIKSDDPIALHGASKASVPATQHEATYAVFIGKDVVGAGVHELGFNLMKMALYTLSQSDEPPVALLFMNEGVKLPTSDNDDLIESIATLGKRGTTLLVCGACLNYYGLTDKLRVGTVSNMLDILQEMQHADKTITL
jgi:selenium metabolism protein YedF